MRSDFFFGKLFKLFKKVFRSKIKTTAKINITIKKKAIIIIMSL